MLEKYAAKLMFQYRIVVSNEANKRRTCEERIILVYSKNARIALEEANGKGAGEEYEFDNDDGNKVYFEFVGVMDLMHLGIESNENEVWYEITEHLSPMENKNKFIPSKNELSAIKNESK